MDKKMSKGKKGKGVIGGTEEESLRWLNGLRQERKGLTMAEGLVSGISWVKKKKCDIRRENRKGWITADKNSTCSHGNRERVLNTSERNESQGLEMDRVESLHRETRDTTSYSGRWQAGSRALYCDLLWCIGKRIRCSEFAEPQKKSMISDLRWMS